MAAEEILWNVGICASTYAELGEAWATLRMMNAQLNEPDGGRVLYDSGAAEYYHTAHELVLDSLRGLDQFLGIQGNYLDGIRRDVHIDLSELKSKFSGKDLEPSQVQQATAGTAILAHKGETPDVLRRLYEGWRDKLLESQPHFSAVVRQCRRQAMEWRAEYNLQEQAEAQARRAEAEAESKARDEAAAAKK